MKAVRIHAFGNASVLELEDVPKPEIGPDEVLVRVSACGVNPVDWKIREGLMEQMVHHALPLTLGWDVAGTVAETGSLVRRFAVGDAVFCRPDTLRNGGYAEYVAVKTIELANAPKSIPLDHAAGIPLASQAAWMALFEVAARRPGRRSSSTGPREASGHSPSSSPGPQVPMSSGRLLRRMPGWSGRSVPTRSSITPPRTSVNR